MDGTTLAGHVTHAGVPGVEVSTGALGHGLGIACGMALAAKRDGHSWRIVTLLSDGECDEGSTWEAVLIALTVTQQRDRKSTRLNSSHLVISYAVFCLKKKN